MAGRGSPHQFMLGRQRDDDNPLRRRPSIWEGKEKLLSGFEKEPSVHSKVPSKPSSRKSNASSVGKSHKSQSSHSKIKDVELELEIEFAELEKHKRAYQRAIKMIENEIFYLKKKKERNIEKARHITDPLDSENIGKEISDVQAKLEQLYYEKSVQLIENEEKIPEIEKQMQLLVKRVNRHKEKIAEENDQELSSDDEPEVRVNPFDVAIDKGNENLDRVEEFVISTVAENKSRLEAAGKEPKPSPSVQQIKEENLKRETERRDLQNQILEQEAKLQRAAEESKRLLEESDRRIAEETQRKLELEEKMRGLAVGSSSDFLSGPTNRITKKEDSQLISILADNNSKFLARQSYAKELPFFSGKAEEWPIFYADFERSTKDCGFSNSENMSRLRKCLKGDAAKYVQSLMVSPDNVPVVMKKLEVRYGQPELIIEAMINKAKEIPPFQVEQPEVFIDFGSAVQNVIATIQTLHRPGHLSNPQLLKEFETKLPWTYKMQWLNWITVDKSRAKDLINFANWLDEQTTLACQACPPSVNIATSVKNTSALDKSGKKKTTMLMENLEDKIPTAAGLLVGGNHNANDRGKCIFCDKHYDSTACYKARSMTIEEKKKVVREKKCCDLCLKPNHYAKSCKSFISCMICMKRHTTLMCPDLRRPEVQQRDLPPAQEEEKQICDQIQFASSNLACTSKVFLKTLLILVYGRNGKRIIRAILDDGSQRSYILQKLAEELSLAVEGNEQIIHKLFGGVQTAVNNHKKYSLQLKNAHGTGYSTIKVLGQNRICGEIPRLSPGVWMKELKMANIWVSDIGEGEPEIELLIGADVLGKLLTGRLLQLSNGLTALETLLGWVLMGKRDGDLLQEDSVSMTVTSMLVSDSSVSQLWELETIGIRDPIEKKTKLENEQMAKKHFLETVKRTKERRYSVSLPWIEGRVKIPDNRKIAEKRLESTTKRLIALEKFDAYDKIFESWCKEDIIEEVKDNVLDVDVHYIPHRAVFKPESSTTPIRPVFDASCKAPRTPSLNECLEKGPNLLELSPSILLKFREGKIGVIADIRKAFQMIEVNENDRDYLRFLWWTDVEKKIYKIFRHRRVVFGVNCSPFLLAAVLEHLLTEVKEHEKPIAQKVLKALYVDNCVTSVNTLDGVVVFKKWSTEKLAQAKMELREWEIGFPVNCGISVTNGIKRGLDFDPTISHGLRKPMTSVLGYKWNKLEDSLSCDIETENLPDRFTKRKILSQLQKIYDPIGFTCPVTLQPKIILQKLWEVKVGWDEELSEDYSSGFRDWCSNLGVLRQIKIPRNMNGGNTLRENWQLHTFGDASKDAYAAVVFLRTEDENQISVQLLMAKSRVAPVNKPTINRLELLSCCIAATLTNFVKESLSIPDSVPTFYWSDSSTALAWIRRNDEWGTFVGNRVRTINSLSNPEDWRHVPGTQNPADLPSRGCNPSQLLLSNWWEGPEWLKKSRNEWPLEKFVTLEDEVAAERKKTSVTCTLYTGATPAENVEPPWYCSKSTYRKNVISIAWLTKYVKFLSTCQPQQNLEKFLSAKDIEEAEMALLKLVQRDVFPDNVSVICGIHVHSRDDGLIRVKTKLNNRDDTDSFRNPILLPHHHVLVDQIIWL